MKTVQTVGIFFCQAEGNWIEGEEKTCNSTERWKPITKDKDTKILQLNIDHCKSVTVGNCSQKQLPNIEHCSSVTTGNVF